MIDFAVIASGSKANCTYIRTPEVTLLIDCGLSAREACKRLAILGLDPGEIDAIIVTHEHSDHIRGISVMSRKFQIPVYCTPLTSRFLSDDINIVTFHVGDTLTFGAGTEICTTSVRHDAVDPLALSISFDSYKFAILTDTGLPSEENINLLKNASTIVIEANYDEECLDLCEYPWKIKERIVSDYGHMSNTLAAQTLAKVWHKDLKNVVIGHVSEKSNLEERIFEALSTFVPDLPRECITLGAADRSTELLSCAYPARHRDTNAERVCEVSQ